MVVVVHKLLRCILLPFIRRPWYVPKVIVSVSTDGGRTYNENVRLIPIRNNATVAVYVKFEIEVKSHEFLSGNRIHYTITHDKRSTESTESIDLNDSIGEHAPKTAQKNEDSFYVVASNKPKRAEIIYRCKYNKISGAMLYQFDITFKCPIRRKIYDKTIKLCFAPQCDGPKQEQSTSTNFKGNLNFSGEVKIIHTNNGTSP
jgi:hypothetical protein